jgi:hypothetical protein
MGAPGDAAIANHVDFIAMRMIDGFNEGWIEFERAEAKSVKGTVEFVSVIKTLVSRLS